MRVLMANVETSLAGLKWWIIDRSLKLWPQSVASRHGGPWGPFGPFLPSVFLALWLGSDGGLDYNRSLCSWLIKWELIFENYSINSINFTNPIDDPVFVYSGGEDAAMTPYKCIVHCMAQQLHQVRLVPRWIYIVCPALWQAPGGRYHPVHHLPLWLWLRPEAWRRPGRGAHTILHILRPLLLSRHGRYLHSQAVPDLRRHHSDLHLWRRIRQDQRVQVRHKTVWEKFYFLFQNASLASYHRPGHVGGKP